MIPVYCYRCSQNSMSIDGVRCLNCDNIEASRPPITRNSVPLVSEPENVSPIYYVSDASTQTTDDDFLLLKPTQEATTQTTDSDFSFLAQIVGCHEYAEGLKIIYPSQVFDQNCAKNHNLSPENMNINNECFQIMNFDRHNNASIEPSPESMNDSYALPKKRTCIDEEPPSNEMQNIPYYEKMFKKQRTDSAEQVNEAGKLNFAGSICFLPAYSLQNVSLESSVIVNKHECRPEISNNSNALAGRSNPSISDYFARTVELAKAILEQGIQKSGKSPRCVFKKKVPVKPFKRCGKCGKRFRKESALKVHVENNCDPEPYKCDHCERKFSCESDLMHHSVKKPFKCHRCPYACKRKAVLITHNERCH